MPNSVANPITANMAAAMPCTGFIGIRAANRSPLNTAGTSAISMPSVVPITTNTGSGYIPQLQPLLFESYNQPQRHARMPLALASIRWNRSRSFRLFHFLPCLHALPRMPAKINSQTCHASCFQASKKTFLFFLRADILSAIVLLCQAGSGLNAVPADIEPK